jgi:hypothetical protein
MLAFCLKIYVIFRFVRVSFEPKAQAVLETAHGLFVALVDRVFKRHVACGFSSDFCSSGLNQTAILSGDKFQVVLST